MWKFVAAFFLSLICARLCDDKITNKFQTYLDSIKTTNINFEELLDQNAVNDANFIWDNILPLMQQEFDSAEEEIQSLPCKWPGNTVCNQTYEPVCVTDLKCIFAVRNKCLVDQLNCGCISHHVLPAKFCKHFSSPNYKRCNIKLIIQ